MSDTIELIAAGGTICLAAVLDLFSPLPRRLGIRALGQALRHRCPEAGLLHHSEQGQPPGRPLS